MKSSLPQGPGLWPAIWMLPEDGSTDTCSGCGSYGGWPRSGEIDIQESVNNGGAAIGTLHYGDYPPNNVMKTNWTLMAQGASNTHAIEWNVNKISWFLNNVQFLSATSADWFTAGAKRSKIAPFDKRFHVLLNMAVGGGWPIDDYLRTTGGTLTTQLVRDSLSSSGGKELAIDWIRVCGKP